MKTFTKLFALVLLSCAMLFDITANAQGQWPYPSPGAPIASGSLAPSVNSGLLDAPDSQIWVKVNGNQTPNPHNKMHTDKSNVLAPSYVTPGAAVDVNFNVNKRMNRYTLVSYAVDRSTGLRTLFDYQSNLYNSGSPVQGNSNQQLVKVPYNCDWEIYLVKGAIESNTVPALSPAGSFMAAPVPVAPNGIITGPVGNPYAYSTDYDDAVPANNLLRTNNRILDYTYGSGADLQNCEACPQISNGNGILDIAPNDDDQIYFRLIEIINNTATSSKQLIFSVINTTNTKDDDYASYDYIGDVLFSNILPAHHPRNNTPYQFRYNYQAGPQLPGYTIGGAPTGLSYGPKDAFIFDQRNNHNNLDYATYQSELFMFEVTNSVYDNLGAPTAPQPEICAELSSKHPEPHKTLHPVFCADIDFCGEPCPPTVDENCFKEDCCFSYLFGNNIGGSDLDENREFFGITNICGLPVESIVITLPPGYDAARLDPTSTSNNTTFTTTLQANSITFTANSLEWNALSEDEEFTYDLSSALMAANNLVTITINTANGGTFTQTFDYLDSDCGELLPVELLTFTGAPTSEGVDLKWETASEKNNDRFEIERSADGKSFEKVGVMKGKGTTSAHSDYKFLDKYANKGLNYYRLRQVDLDGTQAFSSIIKVSSEKGALSLGVKLVPNPCSDQNCSVLLQGVDATKALVVEMRDLTGRLVFSQEIASDQSSFNLPKADLGKGVYILSAKNGLHVTYQKIIIQ